jgi:hypothetical protein
MEVGKINVHQSIVAMPMQMLLILFSIAFATAWPIHYPFILLTGMKCLARLFARGLNNLCAALRFYLVVCRRMPRGAMASSVAGASGGSLQRVV